MDAGLGRGAADVAERLTVNIGVVQGGVKVSHAGECRIEADLRLPPGITKDEVVREANDIIRDYPEVTMTMGEAVTEQATWSDPHGPMLRQLIQKHATDVVVGITPMPVLSIGATTAASGVPEAYRPMSMAARRKAWGCRTKPSRWRNISPCSKCMPWLPWIIC